MLLYPGRRLPGPGWLVHDFTQLQFRKLVYKFFKPPAHAGSNNNRVTVIAILTGIRNNNISDRNNEKHLNRTNKKMNNDTNDTSNEKLACVKHERND